MEIVRSVYYAFFVCLGAAMGSFANVVIYRLPRDMSINSPNRSFCPACGSRIHWFDNIPLLSYFLLRARCRFCKAPISIRYLIVEALSAAAFFACAYHFYPSDGLLDTMVFGVALTASAFCLMLIICSFIDAEHKIIPDVIDIPGIFVGVGLSFALPALQQDREPVESLFHLLLPTGSLPGWLDARLLSLSSSVAGAVAGGALILIVAVVGKRAFKREAMGFGDVKYMAMIGAFIGLKFMLLSFVIACLIGTLIGLPILISGKKYYEIPFGPFLSIGAFVMLIWGNEVSYLILDLYPRWMAGEL